MQQEHWLRLEQKWDTQERWTTRLVIVFFVLLIAIIPLLALMGV